MLVVPIVLGGCSQKASNRLAEFRLAASELPDTLEQVKKAGFPLSWDSLDRHVPASENGADEYNQAFSMIIRPTTMRLPFGKLDDIGPDEVANLVKANAQVIALLKDAAKRKHCDFGNPRTVGIAKPYFGSMLIAARIMAVEARFNTEKGDFSGAIEDIATLVAMEKHLGESKFREGIFSAGAVSRVCSQAAQRLASDARADPTVASALYSQLLQEDPKGDFARILESDIVANNDLINNHYAFLSSVAMGREGFVVVQDAVAGIPENIVKAAFTARFLQLELKLLQISREKLPSSEIFEREAQAIYSDSLGDSTHALNKAGFCILDSEICQGLLRYVALRNVILSGLKLMADQKPSAPWPKSPAANLLLDPFTNQPVQYRSYAKGFVIYSDESELNDGNSAHAIALGNVSFRYPYNFVK